MKLGRILRGKKLMALENAVITRALAQNLIGDSYA
jgi:hypothetical protein